MLISRGLAGFALLAALTGIALSSPRVYPTGVTIYDPSRAYNSFVAFSALDEGGHIGRQHRTSVDFDAADNFQVPPFATCEPHRALDLGIVLGGEFVLVDQVQQQVRELGLDLKAAIVVLP